MDVTFFSINLINKGICVNTCQHNLDISWRLGIFQELGGRGFKYKIKLQKALLSYIENSV